MTEEQKQLVELAAKAMGYEVVDFETDGESEYALVENEGRLKRWNPLTSDSDCFRMETELMIDVEWQDKYREVCCKRFIRGGWECIEEPYGTDKAAARRLASTKVAAEIGKRKESKG